ncbi:MAG: hypothetical protein P8099_00100 [Gemmatimonadota bacterium]
MSHFRLRHALAAAVVGVAMAGACSTHPADQVSTNAYIDRRLRDLAEAHPDSIVGVLIRTSAPPDSTWRASLVDAGLAVGTVAGDVVTGRLRAGSALKVARLPFVVHIELSRKIPILEHPS